MQELKNHPFTIKSDRNRANLPFVMLKCNEINYFLLIVIRYTYFKRVKKLIANKTMETVILRKKEKLSGIVRLSHKYSRIWQKGC